jgi:hypothetical protein
LGAIHIIDVVDILMADVENFFNKLIPNEVILAYLSLYVGDREAKAGVDEAEAKLDFGGKWVVL